MTLACVDVNVNVDVDVDVDGDVDVDVNVTTRNVHLEIARGKKLFIMQPH
jgi:hypothetical protein